VAAFLVYFYIRGLVVGRADEAVTRGIDLIALEQRLGFYWELEMQSWILGHYWAIKVMNWVYFWGHMPLVILAAFWLYVWHRRAYRLSRNAFLASGAIGVVMYALLPSRPAPRTDAGFIDTMAVYDRVGYNAQETEAFVNPYAALPSLHFGWSLLLGFVVFQVTHFPALKLLAMIWPVAMFFAVVMTGTTSSSTPSSARPCRSRGSGSRWHWSAGGRTSRPECEHGGGWARRRGEAPGAAVQAGSLRLPGEVEDPPADHCRRPVAGPERR
jgi:hypothetical protein